MTLNWAAIWAVARKDLLVVTRSKAVMIPMITVPLVLMVLWPAGLAVLMTMAPEPQISQPRALVAALPPEVLESMTGLDGRQRLLVLMLEYVLAPMFLIVPMMVAIVIAADSLAGERERKTLEALLYTPTTDAELLAAKLISSWLPAGAVSAASFAIEMVVVNAAAWPLMERVFFPSLTWVTVALWVAPAASAAALGAVVLLSARVRSYQEANQLGGLVVLPIVALIGGQMTGMFLLTPLYMVALGAALWLVALALLSVGRRVFRRTEIISRI